jgi:hypothetical protein
VNSDPIKARVKEPDLSALDRFAAEQSIARPEAVRRILRDWLISHRYLPDPSGPDERSPGEQSISAATVKATARKGVDSALAKEAGSVEDKTTRRNRLTELPESIRASRRKKGME